MSKLNFAHLRARAYNTPLLLEAGYAAHFFSYFGTRTGAQELATAEGEVISDLPSFAESYTNRRARFNDESGKFEAYAINAKGVASIGIEGSLVHKLGSLDPYSGMQGYDGIIAKLQAAENDSRVKAVLLDIHSPGGEVSGVYDAARAVSQFSKPIAAVADDMMTSAAYLLGSHADIVYASPTAAVGSIGVITAHYDISQALDAQGVRVTLITAGEHKADGNPYEALPPEVYNEAKTRLEKSRREFAGAVSKARGVSVDELLATEARIYSGAEARRLGLVDHVMLPSAVAEHFSRQINKGARPVRGVGPSTTGTNAMTQETKPDEQQADTVSLADHNTALSAARAEGVTEGKTAGHAEGMTAGATAERARIQGIMTSEAAADKQQFALTLATTTDMGVEQASALLAAAPAAQPVSTAPAPDALKQGANLNAPPAADKSTSIQRLEAAASRSGISLVQ